MSLVPLGDRNSNWSVVLRDNLSHSVVLYDRASNRLSLVNDPVLIDKIDSYDTRRFSLPHVCSECGQLVNPSAMRPDVVRDQNYFKLLEATSASNETTGEGTSHLYSSISESAFSQGYFDRFFQSKSVLGKGSRGHVYLVEHILDGVSLGNFALKKIPVGDDHQWLEKVLGEVHLLRLLSHPNLVSYNHVWLENAKMSAFSPSVPCAFILQEYCDGGTLEDYVRVRMGAMDDMNTASLKNAFRRRHQNHNSINSQRTTPSHLLSVDEIRHFMHDIAEGVLHLHRNQIIHRDLKPSNCLLSTSPTGGLPTVLVSDFGEGQLEGSARVGTGSTGTLEYCAPELIQQLAQFSRKTDIFSLGMIMYYLCFSSLPYNDNIFEERQDIEALKRDICSYMGFGSDPPLRTDLPQEFLEVLTRCLSINPAERLTAEQILNMLGSNNEETAQEPSLPPTDVDILKEDQESEQTGDALSHKPRLLLPPVPTDSDDLLVRGEHFAIKLLRYAKRYFWAVKAVSVIPQAMSLMTGLKLPTYAIRCLLVGMELNSARPEQFIWLYGAFWAVSLIWK